MQTFSFNRVELKAAIGVSAKGLRVDTILKRLCTWPSAHASVLLSIKFVIVGTMTGLKVLSLARHFLLFRNVLKKTEQVFLPLLYTL